MLHNVGILHFLIEMWLGKKYDVGTYFEFFVNVGGGTIFCFLMGGKLVIYVGVRRKMSKNVKVVKRKTRVKLGILILIVCLVFSTISPAVASTTVPSDMEKDQALLFSNVLKQMELQQADTTNPFPWTGIDRVNVKSSGEPVSGGTYSKPAINDNGRYVLFESTSRLVDGKRTMHNEVYIHDRLVGTTNLVSIGINQAVANEKSGNASISADGSLVVFESDASNLVENDNNESTDIFLRDLTNQVTERISLAPNGEETDSSSLYPTISADGRYVAFASFASNLIEEEPVGTFSRFMYIHDRERNTTIRVTNSNGDPVNGVNPKISANGQFLVFYSSDSNIVPGDENRNPDVFVYQVVTGEIERVSLTSSGEEANNISHTPAISADGQWITFTSAATNLAEGTTEAKDRVYLHNLITGETELISTGLSGADPDGVSNNPKSGGDGRYVMYESTANNLVAGDFFDPTRTFNDQTDVFVYDTLTKQNERVVVPMEGMPLNGASFSPAISQNGKVIAYVSEANTLVPGDADPYTQDVFVAFDKNNLPVWPSDSAISLTNISHNSLTLNWPSLENQQVIGYRVYQNNRRIGFVASSIHSFDVNGLDPTVTYSFKIEAVNDSNNRSQNGPVLTTSTVDEQSPVWPTNAAIKVEAIAPTTMTLSWPAATDNVRVESYEVLEVVDEQTHTTSALGETPFTNIHLTNLTPNKEYKIMVRARDEAENWSDGIVATVKTLVDDSGKIESALFVEALSGVKTSLRWVPDTQAAVNTYEVWRMKGAEKSLVKSLPSSATTYQDSGLLAETEYSYQVIGKNQAGMETYWTKLVTVTTGQLQVTSLNWSIDQIKGYALQDGVLSVRLNGDANFSGEAVLTYKSAMDVNVGKEQKIPLTENPTSPGTYEGSYPLPVGITELTTLRATLSDSNGHFVTKQAENWQQPIQLLGSLSVNLSFNGSMGDYLKGARLVAWSQTKRSGNSVFLNEKAAYEINQLIPASDYTVRLISANGDVLKEEHNLTVLSGRSQDATIPVDLPASLELEVQGPTGEPITGAQVTLMDENDQYLGSLDTDSNGKTPIQDGFLSGQKVKAQVHLYNHPYFETNQSFTLSSFANLEEVVLTPFAKGKLEGEVTNAEGKPLGNIMVYGEQTLDDRVFNFKTTTDEAGKYSLDVYEGPMTLQFTTFDEKIIGLKDQHAVIQANQTTVLQTKLETSGKGVLNLEVYTKFIGQSWNGPFHVQQLFADGYKIQIQNKTRYWWGGEPLPPSIPINGFIGDVIQVCVYHPTLGSVCEDVAMDGNRNATATIRLEEKGGRVEANVKDSKTKALIGNWQGALYHYDSGRATWDYYQSVSPRGTKLSTNVYESGKYKLEIEHNDSANVKSFAQTEFDILNGEVKILSDILLNAEGVFSGQRGNYFTALPNETTPGRVVTLQGSYQHNLEQPLEKATLLLEIPQGSTFKEGSMMVNGKVPDAAQISHNASQNRYEVTVNDLKAKEEGTIRYQIQLNKDLDQTEIGATLRIAFSNEGVEKEEIIGTAFVRTPQITLQSQGKISALTNLPVSGRAPANSTVNIYTGNTFLGKTKAISTGIWSMNVDLPNLGGPRVYKVRAEATIDEKTYRSGIFDVFYDQDRPKILSLTMIQVDGKRIEIDPSKGVARFPFVVNPKLPIQFEVRFSDANKVKNVELHMGDSFAEAVLEEGVYKGAIPIEGRVGDIYVTYDSANPSPIFEINPIETKEQLETALEEFKQNLPPELKDNQAENITFSEENGAFKTSMDIKSPNAPDPLKLSMTYETGLIYEPTEEDLAFSQAYGVEVFDLSYDLEEVNGEYRIKLSALFPETRAQSSRLSKAVSTDGIEVVRSLNSVGTLAVAGEAVTVTKLAIDYAMKGTDLTLKGVDAYGAGASFGSLAENIARIEVLLEQLAQCPSGPVTSFLEGTLNQAMTYEVMKWGTAIGSAGLGAAATAGTGGLAFPVGVAMFVFGQMVGNSLDASMAKRMQMAEDMVAKQLKKCEDPNDPSNTKLKKPKNDPGGSGGGGGPVAAPVYVFDPSGYVYEAIESNRLEDVTATVLFKNPDTTRWEKWDAEWFEQINPQGTDKNGRYGWDVPEGLWQVIYEKEGYETAKSAELEVQPPHFDVNIGMVSYASPQVSSVRAVASPDGEDYFEVTFTKYIDVDSLVGGTIQVQSANRVVVGTVKVVQKEQEEMDKRLTRIVRFVPTEELIVGRRYSLTVNPGGIFSYSGVPMNGSFTGAVLVEEQDQKAPELIMAKVDPSGNVIYLNFDESLDGKRLVNLDSFHLEGTNAAPAIISLDAFDPNRQKMILHLDGSILASETVMMTIAADTLTDENGNGNQPIQFNVKNTALSSNAELSYLTFNQGILSPSFDSKKKEYTLKVDKKVQQIEMKAILADLKTNLQLDGLPLGSSVSRVVKLTGDETLITLFTKAEDQRTVDSYSIKVVRVEVVPQEPVPNPPVPPTPVPDPPGPPGPTPIPEPTIVGDQADITAWFQKEDGENRFTFNQKAIEQISKLSKVKRATVDLSKMTGDLTVNMPADAMRKLVEMKVELFVKTTGANVILLPSEDQMEDLFEKLGEKEADIMFRLVVSKATATGQQVGANMKPISSGVQVALDLVAGTKVASAFNEKGVQVELLLSPEEAKVVKDSKKLGVYYYGGANGASWKYIRSKNGADGRKLTFVPESSGIYQIMEYRKSFTDIQKHWAKQDIEWLASKHIVIGTNESYLPNSKLTRVQFAAMLMRTLGLKEYHWGEASFKDVSSENWAFGIVEAVTRAGLMDGQNSGLFKPNTFITREEIVVSMIRAIESETGKLELSAEEQQTILAAYKDTNGLDATTKASFAKAIKLGIIKGVNGELQAHNPATRAQAAVIVSRYMDWLE
jgi:chitodextrinase